MKRSILDKQYPAQAILRIDEVERGDYNLSEAKTQGLKDALTFGQQVYNELSEAKYVLPSNVESSDTKLEAQVYKTILRIVQHAQAELRSVGIGD